MHKYTRLNEDKSTYILDVFDNDDDKTLTVVFGDKRKHTNVEKTEENLKKLEEQMELQMDKAIARQPLYVLQTILSTTTTIATSAGAFELISGFESLQSVSSREYLTGAALIAGASYSATLLIKGYSRLSELAKVKYRNKNAEKLCKATEYSHALDSSSQRITKLFSEDDNPLGVLNLDKFTKKDLKKIMTEINREEVMEERGITYVKTK